MTENITDYLIVYTLGGHAFHVIGTTVEDVPQQVFNRDGWASFLLLNGKSIQISAKDIIAIVEAEYQKVFEF